MNDFLLDIFERKIEEDFKHQDGFLAIPEDIRFEILSPVSSSETVETAFLVERNKLNHFRP